MIYFLLVNVPFVQSANFEVEMPQEQDIADSLKQDSILQVKLDSLAALQPVNEEIIFDPNIEFIESVSIAEPARSDSQSSIQYLIFGTLLVCFLIFAILKLRQPAKVRFLISSFYKGKSVMQPFREELILTSASAILLTLNFFIMMGLLGYSAVGYFGLSTPFQGAALLGVITLAVAVAYLLKLLVSWIVQFVIGTDRGITEYRYNVLFYCQNVGLILLPLMFILTYIDPEFKDELLYGAFAVVSLLFCYRIVKSIVIGVRESVPALYLFLYLCTLEFLPLVVVIKLLIGQNSGLD